MTIRITAFPFARFVGRQGAAGFVVSGALLLGLTAHVAAQSSNAAAPDGLVGTWYVQVTLLDCTTNAPIGFPFNSLVTFHSGGTLTETPNAAAFAIGQRSVGHGIWAHSGSRTYVQRMTALIAFDTPPNPPFSPGFSAGWNTVSATIERTANDQFTSTATNEFFASDGSLYRTGCSTAVGRRFS